jgi:hypothetical protein
MPQQTTKHLHLGVAGAHAMWKFYPTNLMLLSSRLRMEIASEVKVKPPPLSMCQLVCQHLPAKLQRFTLSRVASQNLDGRVLRLAVDYLS